jgi:hypothetical protein
LIGKLRQQDSTLALWTWTLGGVAFQLMLTIASMLWVSGNLAIPLPFPNIAYPSDLRISLGLYVVVPIIYSLVVSRYVFKPKRIVSPLNIQLLTIVVFGMLLLARMPSSRFLGPYFDYSNFAWMFGMAWLLAFLVYGIMGFLQTLFVKWWIGMYEGELKPQTYSVTLDFTKLRDVILKEFTDSYDLRIERNRPSLLVVRTVQKCRVVLGIGPDRTDSSKSILCLLPYDYRFYDVATTKDALTLMDDVLFNLKGRLVGRAEITSTEDDPIVTSTAHSIAIQPCQGGYSVTKERWKKVSTPYKYALVATALAWILITILFEEQSMLPNFPIDSTAYLELSVFLFIALVVELGVPMWQESREAKHEEPTLSPSS